LHESKKQLVLAARGNSARFKPPPAFKSVQAISHNR
jgi:hypothetical protein